MSNQEPVSRRDFLMASGFLLEGAWVASNLRSIREAAAYARIAAHEKFAVLTPGESLVLDAIARQIFPSDETPGAREAGIVRFIDRALDTFASDSLAPIRAGLRELQAEVEKRYFGIPTFADLTSERQQGLLRDIEDSEFFEVVRTLTVTGMFALPTYGGNRDEIGWRLLGFDPSPVFTPPFGSYDQAYHEDNG